MGLDQELGKWGLISVEQAVRRRDYLWNETDQSTDEIWKCSTICFNTNELTRKMKIAHPKQGGFDFDPKRRIWHPLSLSLSLPVPLVSTKVLNRGRFVLSWGPIWWDDPPCPQQPCKVQGTMRKVQDVQDTIHKVQVVQDLARWSPLPTMLRALWPVITESTDLKKWTATIYIRSCYYVPHFFNTFWKCRILAKKTYRCKRNENYDVRRIIANLCTWHFIYLMFWI